MTLNVKPEKIGKKNGFSQYFYNPITWVVVGAAFFGIFTFMINSAFIIPLKIEMDAKIDLYNTAIFTRITAIEYQCDKSLGRIIDIDRQLIEMPSSKELTLELMNIKDDIRDLKLSYESTNKMLIDIKRLIIENQKK